MGSGDRFTCGKIHKGFGFAIGVSRFPFSVTVYLNCAFWYVSYGFGRAYDDAAIEQTKEVLK